MFWLGGELAQGTMFKIIRRRELQDSATHMCESSTMTQTKTIKAVVACALGFGIITSVANAQPDVTWQAPVTISGGSDVTNSGIYFGSWAPQDGSANTLPVNG